MKLLQDKKMKKALAFIILSFVAVVFVVGGPAQATSWALLPPVLAIFLAFITGRLGLSLTSAVLLGSFINFYGLGQNVVSGLVLSIQQTLEYFLSAIVGTQSAELVFSGSSFSFATFFGEMSATNLQILGFVFFVLSMVQVMTASGGLGGLVRALQKFIVGPKSAQMVTFILGCLVFIDDYANTMVVGSAMRKITDRYHISREKLAFLVDATSAPIAGVALVSTWIGYEVGLFSEMAEKFNWGVDGYSVFLQALPFRFYCFLMLFFVFVNILMDVDFGPMKSHRRSQVKVKTKDLDEESGPMMCAVFPLLLLLGLVFTLLWYDGGGFSPDKSALSLSDWRQVLTGSENGIFILLVSSGVSYLLAIALAFVLSAHRRDRILPAVWQGLKSSALPMGILILAWSLKLVCDDLKTGEYVANQLSGQVSATLLPLFIFVVSALTAFATGTSWGTMAILIPTVTPLAVTMGDGGYSVYVALCLAAILDGAIMGDHCSPISDTTIMSSISTGCDLLSHVRTQLPYSLLVGGVALVFGYIPAGVGWSLWLSIPLALVLLVGLFFVLKKAQYKKGAA